MNRSISNVRDLILEKKQVRSYILLIFSLSLLCFLCACMISSPALAGRFASTVVEYSPGPGQWVNNPKFNNPSKALGPPQGGTVSEPCNESLVSLGDGGYIVLAFDHPVWDDPRNPYGLDCIVFGNAVWVGGDPTYRWQEPAFIEISMDKNGNGLADDEWYLVLPNKLPSQLIGSPADDCDTGYSATILRNYAEYTPTLALPPGKTPEEFYTVPDRRSVEGDQQSLLIDDGSGGGDAFDIVEAVKQVSPGVPAQPLQYANLPCFHFIRITDALVGDHAGILGEISAEVDAVSCVSPLTDPTPVGEVKRQPTGTVVALAGEVVSAVFAGEIYIQEENRSSGICVRTNSLVTEGDRVAVIGTLEMENNEYLINNARIYLMSPGEPPKPLGMPNSRIGDGNGLSNIGLLVTTWGRVTSTRNDSFFINDGSLDSPGLKVRCNGHTPPTEGQYVIVTGVASLENEESTGVSPIIKVRRQGDILVISD
ncbi:MAG: hypothetical protein QME62_09890 [Armatimonadota bacterium]|nr:hypothetical protein [Armatimonadota bacterium]